MDNVTIDAGPQEPKMITFENLAGFLYSAYCESVGGVNFQGDPLPLWYDFRADQTKTKQSDAWIAVAKKAASIFGSDHE